jgi:phosphomannomutase
MLKFGTSGIRGIFNNNFSTYYTNKLCFSLSLNLNGRICLGYDTRNTSLLLSKNINSGLQYYGKDIIDLGCIPTPVLAYYIKKFRYDWGLAITASHNPPEFIGIKIFDSNGSEIDAEYEKKIEVSLNKYIDKNKSKRTKKTNDYKYRNMYIREIIKFVPKTKKKLKILVDNGNGTTINYTPTVLSKLGHNVVTINSHPTIESIGRVLEPNLITLKELSYFVKSNNFDLCIAHDGDGDRIALIDNKGKIIEEQLLSSLVIKILCSNEKSGSIIISTNTSQSVARFIDGLGLKTIFGKIGKTFLHISDNDGLMSIEPSKITYNKWGNWEDGIFIAAIITQYLSYYNVKLSRITSELPFNYYYQKNIRIQNISKSLFKENILKKYSGYKIDYSDGFKVFYDKESYLLFRISGTEPKIRAYVDSYNETISNKLLKDAIKFIRNLN